jgi:hypothetical protein
VTEKVNLGIIRNEKGDVHFVIVTKLGTIFSRVNDKNYSHVKMCRDCGLVFKTSERLLQHYKEDHKDETMKKQVLKLPEEENSWVRFNIDDNPDFTKTMRQFFVCYADFESSNIPSLEMKTDKTRILMRQIPNSYMLFCPDLMFLEDDQKLKKDSYLKKYHSDDPYMVLAKFIGDLETIRASCIFRWQSHPRLPKLTNEEQEKYDAAQVCEKCKKSFGPELPKVRHHCHVTGKYKGVVSALQLPRRQEEAAAGGVLPQSAGLRCAHDFEVWLDGDCEATWKRWLCSPVHHWQVRGKADLVPVWKFYLSRFASPLGMQTRACR